MSNWPSFETNNVVRAAVGAIVLREGTTGLEVLLGSRINKDGHGDGEWQFPGGKLDWMETTEMCCVREAHEETGILVQPIQQVGCTNDIWPAPVNKHFLTLYYTCAVFPSNQTPKVMEPDKCSGWIWFPLDSMPQNMMQGAVKILKKHFGEKFRQV